MNIQALSDNEELIRPIRTFFIKRSGIVHVETNIAHFFESSIRNPSNIYFIQYDLENLTLILDLIKDIRTYFGAFPLIFIIGKKDTALNPTIFLNVGADDVLFYPYDLTILEDFLGHSLQRDTFLPIKYRNVPSGGSPVQLSRPATLIEINSNGIEFLSEDFIARGTIFSFNLKNHLDITPPNVKCKIITSLIEAEKDCYKYFAEFYDTSIDLMKQIRFLLKQ